jgi:hypothetical protein
VKVFSDSFITYFPYIVVLVIAPAALFFGAPLIAIVTCSVSLAIVINHFGGFIQFPLFLFTSLQLCLGIGIILVPGFRSAFDAVKLWLVAIPMALIYVVLLLSRWDDRSSERQLDKLAKTLPELPLEKLISYLDWVYYNEPINKRILQRLKDERDQAVPLMIERYRKHRRERKALISALGCIPHPMGFAFLREVLKTEKKYNSLLTAVETCGKTGDPAFVPALAKLIDSHGDVFIRMSAFKALEQIGTPQAIEILKKRQAMEGEAYLAERD